MSEPLTHLDEQGRLRMVDVGSKEPVRRRAVAEGYFGASGGTLDRLEAGDLPKGEALAAARLAGIQAAKRCGELIPLCHTLPLEVVTVEFERAGPTSLRITATAAATARTGVEMETLTAVAAAALCLWDMTKGVDQDLRIEHVRLLSKQKSPPPGRSGG